MNYSVILMSFVLICFQFQKLYIPLQSYVDTKKTLLYDNKNSLNLLVIIKAEQGYLLIFTMKSLYFYRSLKLHQN